MNIAATSGNMIFPGNHRLMLFSKSIRKNEHDVQIYL